MISSTYWPVLWTYLYWHVFMTHTSTLDWNGMISSAHWPAPWTGMECVYDLDQLRPTDPYLGLEWNVFTTLTSSHNDLYFRTGMGWYHRLTDLYFGHTCTGMCLWPRPVPWSRTGWYHGLAGLYFGPNWMHREPHPEVQGQSIVLVLSIYIYYLSRL